MVQSYKNESKSQHKLKDDPKKASCDVCYKVKKMRANNNLSDSSPENDEAVMYGTKLQK